MNNNGLDYICRKLIAEADPEVCAEHSFRNYHALGLHYLNLVRTPQLTVKLYVFDNVQNNECGYVVWPHNHRYSFSHYTLFGSVTNHVFGAGEYGNWSRYRYNSEDGALDFQEKCLLSRQSMTLVVAGGFYSLEPHEIHTISVGDGLSAAVLWQHTDCEGVTETDMYAPFGVDVSCGGDGLYVKPSAGDYSEIMAMVKERMER